MRYSHSTDFRHSSFLPDTVQQTNSLHRNIHRYQVDAGAYPSGSGSGSESGGGGSPVSSGQLSSSSDQGYRSQAESPRPRRRQPPPSSNGPLGRRSRNSSLKGILRNSRSENNLRHQQKQPVLHIHQWVGDPEVESGAYPSGSGSGSESGGGSYPVSSGQLSSSSDQGYRSQADSPRPRRRQPPPSSNGPLGRRSRNSSLKGILRNSRSENNLRHQQKQPMNSTELSAEELYQIRLMFSGKGTEVVVASCLANLYFAHKQPNGKVSWSEEDRELKATGVPVLVLDKGDSRARSFRRLHIILAERGTGFLLWRDIIDNLSKYTEIGRSFHTMFLSTNHQKQAGLSFDTQYAAMEFFAAVRDATLNPDNVALSQENLGKLRKSQSRPEGLNPKRGGIRKSEISQPCAFAHITSLKPQDLETEPGERQRARAQSCLHLSPKHALS